jgi:hypothetical protein
MIAQVQRLRRTGARNRIDKAPDRAKKATVPHLAQLIGGRNGIRTGVNAESCSASGWASKPLSKGGHVDIPSCFFFRCTYEENSWVTGVSGLGDLRGPAAGRKFRTTGAESTPI